MPDIRTWSIPFGVVAGVGFSGEGGVDSFLTIASSPETSTNHVTTAGDLTGRLYSVTVSNYSTALVYLQIWCGATPTVGPPFPLLPTMQFGVAPVSAAGGAGGNIQPQVFGRDFFGISGLEFVGPGKPNGSRGKLPVSQYASVAPNLCGFCLAISSTPSVYTAATPSNFDMSGSYGQ